jgi:hypothetical protein
MGYFANGTEGELYQAHWCARCVHEDADRGCPVWDLHLLYNYDQNKKKSTADALALLIPLRTDGLGNDRCRMFWEKGSRGGGQPEPLPVPLAIVRAA